MAGNLSLISGTPRIGLNRQNNYSSLHGDSLQTSDKSRKPNLPLSAPPRDSSSDEESDQQVPDDSVSDDSESGGTETKKKINVPAALSTRTNSNSAKGHKSKRRALSVEPSNIRAGTFTSGTGPRSCNGSQSSQKRKDIDVDDDDMPLSFSQHKKPRQSYGYGSTTVPKGLVMKPGNRTKVAPTSSDKAKPRFRDSKSDAILAQVDRLRAELPIGRESPATQTSQRCQRASQRSAKSTQESSQNSSNKFKQPPRQSPKKAPKFRASPVVCEDPPRAIRSTALAKKSSVPTKDNVLKSSKLQNALNTATDKLGISNMQINLPPSAMRYSSAPSTSLDAATTMSSPLSSLGDSPLGSSQEGIPIITSEDIPLYNAKTKQAVCPMCKQPVDMSYLEEFSKVNTRMSLRQQAQFCKAHKERNAESEWAERGYPKIDWQQLDDRMKKYHTFLDDILSRRKFSFYRNAFEDFLKSGKNKTLQESLIGADEIEGSSPGYYGGRGAKLMADNILSRFAGKLRRLAASDKLISSGGVSRYVQAVLVPELAVLLIKDDMKVDEEKAREVLRDSVDIGNLLNEEEDEIITDPTPKEKEVLDMM